VRNQRQTVRSLIQFSPSTDISIPRHEEIDGSLEFAGPILSSRDDASSGIDLDDRSCRYHRGKGVVAFTDDTATVWRACRATLSGQQRLIVRWFRGKEETWNRISCLVFKRTGGQQHGGVRDGKCPQRRRFEGSLVCGSQIGFWCNSEVRSSTLVFRRVEDQR
jgi:hypothetical protein